MTATATHSLFLHQLRLDAERLMALARGRRLPLGDADLGYLVHMGLRELFGDAAPSPFVARGGRGRWLEVLGYADADAEALRTHAERFASPAAFELLDRATSAAKPLPDRWPAELRVGFEVRVCPVVRTGKEHAHHRKGAEVDAFLVRCREAGEGEPVDRGDVYADWLGDQLQRLGGARLQSVRMRSFRRTRLLRRTQGAKRHARKVERPDAVLDGELQVIDGPAFVTMLRRGIGRHRAFGFGMLLLRPAGAPRC